MENLLALYKEWSGAAPLKAETLPKAGSNRRYVRLHGRCGKTVIGVDGTSVSENHSFVYLASHFTSKGLPMPRILAINDDETCYLQEDLGDCQLFGALESELTDGNFSPVKMGWIRSTVAALPAVQHLTGKALDWSICFPDREFNRRMVSFDLNYFKYDFL